MLEILISIPSARRLRHRLTLITILVGLPMMTNHALSASPDVQSVVGMWNLNLDGTNRTCRVTLRNDPGASNYAIGMPAGCRRAMPDVSPTTAWSKDDNGVALRDATGAVVLQFSARDDGTLMANTADGKSYSLVALDGRKFKPAVGTTPAPSPQNLADKNTKDAPPAQIPAPSGTAAVQKPLVGAISREATQSTSAPAMAPTTSQAPVKQPSNVGQTAKQSPDAVAPPAEPAKPAPTSTGGAVLANTSKPQNPPTAPDAATGRQANAAAAGAAVLATPQVQQSAPAPMTSAPAAVKQALPPPAPVPTPSIRRVDASSVSTKQPELGLAPTIVPSMPRPDAAAAPVTAVPTKKPVTAPVVAIAPAPNPSEPVRAAAPAAPAAKTAPAVIAAVQPPALPPRTVPPQSVQPKSESVQPSGQSIASSDQTGPTPIPVRQVGPTGIRPAPPRPTSASNESAPAAPNWTGAIQPPAPRPMHIAAWSELSKVISTPDYSTQLVEVPEVVGPDGQTIQAPPTNPGAPVPASASAPAGAPMQIVHIVPQNLRPNGPTPGLQAVAVDATANNDLMAAMTSAQVAQVSGRYAVWRGKGTGTGCILNLDGKTRGPLGNFRASLSPACRDQGVALLDPTGWTIEHGRIVLTTRTGSASFDRRPDGTWSGDAEGLVLTRD
jgi:hypothetical protein